MTKNDDHCWICGNKADSREHRIKRSDIKQVVGEASQGKPIYMHDAKKRNKIVQSTNAKIFKGEKDLCSKCNNELTQPYDKAWEKLSAYLNSNWSDVIEKGAFRMSKVFPNDTRAGMLGVHLFFSKFLGCSIKEGGVSLETKVLADGIKDCKPVPKFWMAIGPTPGSEYIETVSATDLMVASDNNKGKEVAATQLYTCGDFSVQMVYSISDDTIYDMSNKWHPSQGTKMFKLSDLNADE
jgi:hypothetical protein